MASLEAFHGWEGHALLISDIGTPTARFTVHAAAGRIALPSGSLTLFLGIGGQIRRLRRAWHPARLYD